MVGEGEHDSAVGRRSEVAKQHVLVSWGCCDKVPQLALTTEIY